MHALVAGLILGLIATFVPPPMTVGVSEAGDLLSTHKRHYTRGPSRGGSKAFSGSTRSRRTIVVDAQNPTLFAQEDGLIAQSAEFDPEASKACRESRLRRLGGGIAEFAKDRFPAAYARHMSRAEGIRLSSKLYIFINESSTACKVYTYGP
jgi:hypothetical protein